MDCKITLLNGESFILSDYGIHVKDFNPKSIPVIKDREQLDGAPLTAIPSIYYGEREIMIDFYIRSMDRLGYPLLRDRFYELMIRDEPFYIQEMRLVGDDGYQFRDTKRSYDKEKESEHWLSMKRYLVTIDSTIDFDQTFTIGEGELTLSTYRLPFAESVGTTKDPLLRSTELWDYGQGLTYEDKKYIFDTNEFVVHNAGNVPLNPRWMPCLVKILGVGNNVSIENKTNGDKVVYNGSMTNGDILTLDGIYVKKNGVNVLRQTNKQLLTLEPGKNEIAIQGLTNISADFDFRFYYK